MSDDAIQRGIEGAQAETGRALAAGRMGAWSWDIVGEHVRGDHLMADLFGLDFGSQPWPIAEIFAAIAPEDLPDTQIAVSRALDGSAIYETEFRTAQVPRWLGARGQVTQRGDDGAPLMMVGVNWDITDKKLMEQQLEMLAGEMDHRVKNAFAVIRALINLGTRTQTNMATFAETLKAQVQAMATAHTVSARIARETSANNTPVPLQEVIDIALAPWAETHAMTCKVSVDMILHAGEVSAMSMLIYELVTNAAKHGALREQGGTLSISAVAQPDGTRLLHWVEKRQVSNVATLARRDPEKGFGSVLLDHCAATLGADLQQNFTESGVDVTVRLP